MIYTYVISKQKLSKKIIITICVTLAVSSIVAIIAVTHGCGIPSSDGYYRCKYPDDSGYSRACVNEYNLFHPKPKSQTTYFGFSTIPCPGIPQ